MPALIKKTRKERNGRPARGPAGIKMTIICYKDETGQSRWDRIPGPAETALARWQADHPDVKAAYQFPDTSSILVEDDDKARIKFEKLAGQYGLSPLDYGRKILLPDGGTAIVQGIAPRRRKYTIAVWNYDQNQTVLCTPGCVRNGIERYQNRGA